MRACLRGIARVQITDLIQSKLVLTSGVRSAQAAPPRTRLTEHARVDAARLPRRASGVRSAQAAQTRARHVSSSSFCCIALALPLLPAFLSPH